MRQNRRWMQKGAAILAMAASTALSGWPTPVFSAIPDDGVFDVHLTPKNLTYQYNNAPLAANVTGYNYIGGMMLPLAQTADVIGSYIKVNAPAGTASGWVESPDNSFSLNMKNRTIQLGDEERMIPQGVLSLVGNEIYMDASFLASLLPVRFLINYDVNAVELIPQTDLRVFQRMDFISNYFADVRSWGQNVPPEWPQSAQMPPAATASYGQPQQTPTTGVGLTPQVAGSVKEGRPASVPVGDSQIATHSPPAVASGQAGVPASPSVDSNALQPVGPTSSSQSREDVNQSAPVTPVYAENTAAAKEATDEKSRRPGAINVTSWNRIVLDTQENSGPLQAGSATLNEDDLLILQPELEKIRGDYIEVYRHENGYYLPLGHLMDILEIAIGVNPVGMEASGFYISEDQTFYLDGNANEAIINGTRTTFPDGLIVTNPFELYVDANLLSQLLPIDFQLDVSQLTLAVLPEVELPIQARLRREEKWNERAAWHAFTTSARLRNKDLPLIETPYELVTPPTVDVRAGTAYFSGVDSDNDPVRGDLSVVATGDVGYANVEAFAQADTAEGDQPLRTLRIKAGREDYQGRLLGPLQATEVYVGDVQSYPMPLVSDSNLGRGAKISNRDTRRPDLFDRTNFFGDAQPGWEVELYQNSVLIDFQVVGEDGRYQFENVPVYYGDNTFRIVQYGPQGQKREEVRDFNIGDDMPQKGEFHYAASANEVNQDIFGLGNNLAPVNRGREDGWAFVGQAEYGLTNWLSAGVGAAQVPLRNQTGNVATYRFASAGMKASLMGIRTSFDMAYDVENGGWGTQLTGFTRWNGYNIRAEQRFYNDFESSEQRRSFVRPLLIDPDPLDDVFTIDSRSESRTELNVSRNYDLPVLNSVNTAFNLRHEEYEAGESDSAVGMRLSKTIDRSNISGDIRYRNISGTQTSDDNTVDGSLSLRHRLDDLLIRGVARYEVTPDTELTGFNLSLQKQFTDMVNGRLDYTQSLIGNERKRLTGYLNWDFETFYLSPRFEIDEEADYILGLDLQFSLGMDDRTNQWLMTSERIAQSGSLSTRAFLDENNDGIMNEGEQPLQDVAIVGSGTAYTNEQGYAYTPRIPTHYPYRVQADTSNIMDFVAKPKEEAYNIVARPGVTTKLDIPVIPTLDIDGNAYLELNGEEIEYPGLLLELVNEEGEVVKGIRTEYDGYYYLAEITPGNYTLRISEKEAEYKQLSAESYAVNTVQLRNEHPDGYVQGYDFHVKRELTEEQVAALAEEEAQDALEDAEILLNGEEEPLSPQITPTVSVPANVPEGKNPNDNVITPVSGPATVEADQISPETLLPALPAVDEQERASFVQTGMFCDYTNAQRQLETLQIAGFDANIRAREYQGNSCFTVQIGPAADLAAAERVIESLEKLGIGSATIVEENAEIYE